MLKVLHRFRGALPKLNPLKCKLLQKRIWDMYELRPARKWPLPKDNHEFRSFLYLCTYYRNFIAGFSNITKPLSDFQWSPEAEVAFQFLNERLCMAPAIGYPQPGEKCIVYADATCIGIGICYHSCRRARTCS